MLNLYMFSTLQAGVDIGVKKNIVFRWQPPAGHDVSDKLPSHFVKGTQSRYFELLLSHKKYPISGPSRNGPLESKIPVRE